MIGDFVCTSANDGTHLFRPVSARAHTFWQAQNYNKFVIDNTEDYLLENVLVFSIATFYDALSVDLTLSHSFNSKYEGNNKVLKPLDEWESVFDPDYGDFVAKETYYKDTDMSVSIGFSLAF